MLCVTLEYLFKWFEPILTNFLSECVENKILKCSTILLFFSNEQACVLSAVFFILSFPWINLCLLFFLIDWASILSWICAEYNNKKRRIAKYFGAKRAQIVSECLVSVTNPESKRTETLKKKTTQEWQNINFSEVSSHEHWCKSWRTFVGGAKTRRSLNLKQLGDQNTFWQVQTHSCTEKKTAAVFALHTNLIENGSATL